MHNKDVREAAASANVKLWQIAEKLNLSDCNFSRKLRKELSETEKDRIYRIIRDLSQEVV